MDDASLWSQFQDTTLPEPEWKHRTHLRIAFMHLQRWSLDESHLRMRVAIIRLNGAHGLVETPERGYHETLTRTWLMIVDAARREPPRYDDSEAFLASHPELVDKSLPLRSYSQELLMSLRARTIFVEPDRWSSHKA